MCLIPKLWITPIHCSGIGNLLSANPVFIPNGFTPNGDGNNDRFKVSHYNFEKVQEFRIFNRFGEEVFSGANNDGWDGTYKKQKLDMYKTHGDNKKIISKIIFQ